MKKISLFLALLVLSSNLIFTQSSVEIISVDPTDFPTMKAEVKVFDENGVDARDNLRQEDFIITDAGIQRQPEFLLCDNNRRKISLILTIDRSGSMEIRRNEFGGRTGKEVAEEVAKKFIDQFPDDGGEFGITSFSAGPSNPTNVIAEFTDQKDTLKERLNDLFYVQETDYNRAFFGDTIYKGDPINEFVHEGIFQLASRAKYSTFVIFITDGKHSVGPFERGLVQNYANKNDIRIYPISIGLDLPESLDLLADGTGGFVGNNLTEDYQFDNFYLQLLESATLIASPAPCELQWITDCDGGDLNITYNGFGNPSKDTVYTIPDEVKPYIDFSADVEFFNDGFNGDARLPITITARNRNINLDGFTSTDPRYTITGDLNRTLNKDQSVVLDVVFNSGVRECVDASITLGGTSCTNTFNVNSTFIFAEDVNVGGSTIGVTSDYTATQTFCNYSDEPLDVTNIDIFGGNAGGEFEVTSSKNFTIDPCSCVDITFSFNPSVTGDRNSEYTVETNRGDFSADIFGTGGGSAQISANDPDPVSVNCEVNLQRITIPVSNPGVVELTISDIQVQGADMADFVIVTPITTVGIGNTENIELDFIATDPTNFGARNAELLITNNSQNNTSLVLNLTGRVNDVGFDLDKQSIDFGVLCPGESVEDFVNITNSSGSLGDFSITSTVDNNFYTLDNTDYFLSNNGNETTRVSFSTVDVGPYDGTITYTDACGDVKTVTLSAVVSQPELEIVNGATLTSNIGEPTASQLEVRNNSEHVLSIVGGSIDDTQITFISNVNDGSIVIQPNQTSLIDIEYLPVLNQDITTAITLETDKCGYTFTGSINAAPDLLNASIEVINSQALIDQEFDMQIEFKDKTPGYEVLTTDLISFQLVYDSRYIEYIDQPGITAVEDVDQTNFATLTVTDYQINNDDTDDIVLKFRALNGAVGVNSIPVRIINSAADGFSITNIDGEFSLVLIAAKLNLEDKEHRTGEVFSFPIIINDEDGNLQDFHTGITAQVTFNPLVLEPINNQYDITYSENFASATMQLEEVINFDTPIATKDPTIQDVEQFLVATLDFRVMYGNERETSIVIENVNTINGAVEVADSVGVVTITDICDYGDNEYRFIELADGLTPASVNISSASYQSVEFSISTLEEYIHNLSIYSSNGSLIFTQSGFETPGNHILKVDNQNLIQGSYFVVFEGLSSTSSVHFVITK